MPFFELFPAFLVDETNEVFGDFVGILSRDEGDPVYIRGEWRIFLML